MYASESDAYAVVFELIGKWRKPLLFPLMEAFSRHIHIHGGFHVVATFETPLILKRWNVSMWFCQRYEVFFFSQVNLYRGFVAICHPDEHHLSLVDRLVEVASGLCIKEWRRLPHIVSHIHIPYLQVS